MASRMLSPSPSNNSEEGDGCESYFSNSSQTNSYSESCHSDSLELPALSCQDLLILREKFQFLDTSEIMSPEPGDSCHVPPLGYFTVYMEFLNSELVIPPPPLLVELVSSLGVSFSQLTPNALLYFFAFCHRMTEIRMPLNVELFHSVFLVGRSTPDSYIYFYPRPNCTFLCKLPTPRGSWKLEFFYVEDRGWDVPEDWSSGLSKIKLTDDHRALQLRCRSLGLFESIFDHRSLLPSGRKIDLAVIRAHKGVEGRRHPPRAPWVKTNNHRDAVASRESSRKGETLTQTDRPRDSDPKTRQVVDLSHSSANGKRKDHVGHSTEDVRRRGEDDTPKNPRRGRDEERGAPLKVTKVDHLFVDGVNQKDDAGSFWDLNDPGIGWKRGRELVGDFDMLHLLPKSTDSLTHSLAWNACQTLLLASAFRVREERFRNTEDRLRDELARLREENKRLGDERAKAKDECSRVQRELDEKLKAFGDVHKDFDNLKKEHSAELESGAHFLGSIVGKALLVSTGEKAIEAYRASEAFEGDVLKRAASLHDEIVVDCRQQLRETGLVAEDIIMMIEPSVPEPIEGALGDLLGDIGDAEMIEALNLFPADGVNAEP